MFDYSLSRFLEIGPGSCVAFIGGGGKTTLMLSLARDLRETGRRPIVTTTTKIWVPKNMQLVLGDPTGLATALASFGIACFGRRVSPEGKLEGPDPDTLCALLAQGIGPILAEADGSAGRSLKIHADHEPVVPICATHVVIVAGVDVLGHHAGDAVIHRARLAYSTLGWTAEDRLTPNHIATLLSRMTGFTPPCAQSWFVLNKVDSELDLAAAREIAAHLAGIQSPVLMTSRGRVIAAVEKPASAGVAFP